MLLKLYEFALSYAVRKDNIKLFNQICDKFPRLQKAYDEKIHREYADCFLPPTEEEKREIEESYKKLCERIRAEYGEDAI